MVEFKVLSHKFDEESRIDPIALGRVNTIKRKYES